MKVFPEHLSIDFLVEWISRCWPHSLPQLYPEQKINKFVLGRWGKECYSHEGLCTNIKFQRSNFYGSDRIGRW